jgi:iron(III) transport system substrate-binding protein
VKRQTMPLTREAFVRTSLATGALAIGSRQAVGAAPAVTKPAGWDRLVAAANAEGALTIYGPPSNENYTALVTRFQRAYPGIKVAFTTGYDVGTRIMAERSAGRYIPDIYVLGSSTPLRTLKPAGALVPLEPLIIRPEILDKSAWFQNELWWTDARKPYTNIVFSGVMIPPAYYNTTLAKASDFQSYWDLTNKKWRGKVISNDIRIPGPGGVPARFIYKHAGLGPRWFDSFFNGLDVQLANDQRQLVDWLAQGRYAISAFVDEDVAQTAIVEGLPIAPVSIERLKEGGAVAPGPGSLSPMNNAPHPNAAQLYVNWLLSREGQIAWQEETKTASLRIDIPKNIPGLYLQPLAKKGVTYPNGGAEDYSILTSTVFRELIKGRN